jgi:protein TonB
MSIEALQTGSSWRTGIRWSAAAFVVLAAHVAGAWIIAQRPPEPSVGEAASAILIELAPLPAAPATEALHVPPGPEANTIQPQPVADMPKPELDLPPPPEPAEPAFDVAELQPPPPLALKPEVVLPEPPKKLRVAGAPKPEVRKPVQRQDQERRQAKPQTKAITSPPRPQTSAAAHAAPATGSIPSSSASPASWKGALIAHLNRAKRYPPEARQRGEEGTVHLNFSIDRSGRVVGYRIIGSSGSSALDQEALAMIQRASPLPAPPTDIGGARISLTVPVRFNIN